MVIYYLVITFYWVFFFSLVIVNLTRYLKEPLQIIDFLSLHRCPSHEVFSIVSKKMMENVEFLQC